MMLADQPQRDAIASEPTGFSIRAAAGSGKTTAVVERMVRRLTDADSPIDPHELIAITYTRAAAEELRSRVRAGLNARTRDGETEVAARAHAALEAFDEATIGTIHSFATDLIQRYSLVCDIPPRISIVEDDAANAGTASLHTALQHALLSDPSYAEVLDTIFALGFQPQQLKDVVQALHGLDVDVNLPVEGVLSPSAAVAAANGILRDMVSRARVELDSLWEIVANADPTLPFRRSLVEFRAQLESLEGLAVAHQASAMGTWKLDTRLLGKQADWKAAGLFIDSATQKEREGRVKRLRQFIADSITAARGTLFSCVAEYLRVPLAAAAEEHRRTGRLTYGDLIAVATTVLKAPDCDFGGDIREIVVDEVQDTDPTQVEFLQLVVEKCRAAAPEGSTCELVLVGDVRQSIYGFRGASPTAVEVLDPFAGSSLELTTNFRSRPEILDWVATAFEHLAPHASPSFGRMHAARPSVDSHWERVTCFGGVAPTANEVRQSQAEEVSALIQLLLSDPPLVEADGVLRPAAASDIAILLPTRTGVATLIAHLDAAHIPYQLEAGELLYAADEVDELIALFAATSDELRLETLVAALRVPPFSCSDVELQMAVASVKQFVASGVAPETQDRVSTALRSLLQLREVCSSLPLADAMELAFAFYDLESIAMQRGGQVSARASLRFARDRVLATVLDASSNSPIVTLADAAEWLRAHRNAKSMLTRAKEDRDAVVISTMHASKGLEYPIVILCDLPQGISRVKSRALVDQGQIALRVGSKTSGTEFFTPSFDSIRAKKQAAANAEQLRLIYVAATRAREFLFCSLWRKQVSTNSKKSSDTDSGNDSGNDSGTDSSRAVNIPNKLAEHVEAMSIAALDPGDLREVGTPSVAVSNARHSGKVHWSEMVPARVVPAAYVPAIPRRSPSRLVVHEPSLVLEKGRFLSDRLFGSVVHRCLELELFDPSEAELDQLIAETTNRAATDTTRQDEIRLMRSVARKRELRECLRAADESTEMHELFRGATVHRELAILAGLGEVGIRGTLDVVLEFENQVSIFDYKTDTFDPLQPAVLVDHYAAQLGAYVVAMEHAVHKPVTECGLIVINPDRCEILRCDPEIARASATAQLAQILG